ncbi:MAG: macro domain-containing protein [Bacillota bacterium]|nr:macro domain-containing protein [Bacillota bacterium]
MHADAIVNAANETLLGGGGVDGAIHRAAGGELLEECRTLGGCDVGQAKITKGYRLPAKYVIHTVGPIWRGGGEGEEALLADCYRNSLELARSNGLESIAFPLIASGTFGYPKDRALKTAIAVIGDFLLQHDMTVYLVVFDKKAFALSEKLFASITQYIDDRYVDTHRIRRTGLSVQSRQGQPIVAKEMNLEEPLVVYTMEEALSPSKRSLEEVVSQLDETFSQMLLRKIDEKGLTDAETYKRANIDRKLFSKIRNDIRYQPSKPTVLAFAIALELSLDETSDLLQKAGFALSRSSRFDLIVQYFIEEEKYSIFEINEALFAFDQQTLGV